jgi:hypothetical protein
MYQGSISRCIPQEEGEMQCPTPKFYDPFLSTRLVASHARKGQRKNVVRLMVNTKCPIWLLKAKEQVRICSHSATIVARKPEFNFDICEYRHVRVACGHLPLTPVPYHLRHCQQLPKSDFSLTWKWESFEKWIFCSTLSTLWIRSSSK